MNVSCEDPESAQATYLYRTSFSFLDGVNVLIASTPQSRRILTTPELCGADFQESLATSLKSIARSLSLLGATEDVARHLQTSPLDVVYILRGGLNFDLHRCLERVGGRRCEVSFVSSQRKMSSGIFTVIEDEYRKWNLHDKSMICLGDIIATGTTMIRVLNDIGAAMKAEGKRARWLLLVVIGTFQSLQPVCRAINQLAAAVDLEGATLIFLEQIFNLFDGSDPFLAETHMAQTDFLRNSFPRALAFEEESLRRPLCYLERCAIYDGGSRAFEPQIYIDQLKLYWRRMAGIDHQALFRLLARKTDLLSLRSPGEWSDRVAGRSITPGSDILVSPVLSLTEFYEQAQEAVAYLKRSRISDLCVQRSQEIERSMP